MASETFKRFLTSYPGWGRNGGHIHLDDYVIDVDHDTGHMSDAHCWWLSHNDLVVRSGRAIHPALAWQQACHALDAHRAELEAAV